MFLGDLQTAITKKLFDSGIETSSLDSRIILKEVFCFNEKELILNSQSIVTKNKISEVDKILVRRISGEPVSKIFGKRDFYESTFLISEDVLDPRPETELIIE